MTKRDSLMREIEQLPEPLLDEVLLFVRVVKANVAEGCCEFAIASERILGRDWLRRAEEAAWRNL